MDVAPAAVAARGKLAAIVALLRPHQWLKNGVVLAPLVFAHRLLDPHAVVLALVAVVACCAISSAGYALNDLLDVELDRRHPVKRARPLASGALTPAEGGAVLAVAAAIGVGVSLALGRQVAVLVVSYLALQYAYSRALKRIVILDVIVVAVGFIMRAYVGGLAIGVDVSPWLALITFLLALFLALNRRRQELVALGDVAAAHRGVLADYTPALLDQMIAPVTAATLVAYMIYSVSPEVTERLGTHWVHLTVPFVVFGMFRYLYLVHRRQAGDDPARILLGDGPLLASVLLWIAANLILLYGWRLLGS
jgi:4-hydroxybenzoate polyprenyltransferase